MIESVLECGVAEFVLPGFSACGDQYLIQGDRSGILLAAVDGVGHGEEAAAVARAAVSTLRSNLDHPIIAMVEKCHESLHATRGVVLSLAFIDAEQQMLTWLGVGNVQGALMRVGAKKGSAPEMLLLRGGVVGSQLPALQATVLRVAGGDTLFFATDGIRGNFIEGLSSRENPQRAADRILEEYRSGHDDALVLVARLKGNQP